MLLPQQATVPSARSPQVDSPPEEIWVKALVVVLAPPSVGAALSGTPPAWPAIPASCTPPFVPTPPSVRLLVTAPGAPPIGDRPHADVAKTSRANLRVAFAITETL